MKSIIYTAVLFTLCVLSPRPSLATDWWTLSDQDFANQYAPQAFSATIKDQSSVAWMLFARVNQPTQNQGQTISQWESWPSNDETFSPAVGLFKAESKVRTRPHLQAPKTAKIAGQQNFAHLFSVPPNGGGEEVTRNLRQMRFRILRVEHLKGRAYGTVQTHPPRRRDALIKSIPDENVREAKSLGCVGQAGQQSR